MQTSTILEVPELDFKIKNLENFLDLVCNKLNDKYSRKKSKSLFYDIELTINVQKYIPKCKKGDPMYNNSHVDFSLTHSNYEPSKYNTHPLPRKD